MIPEERVRVVDAWDADTEDIFSTTVSGLANRSQRTLATIETDNERPPMPFVPSSVPDVSGRDRHRRFFDRSRDSPALNEMFPGDRGASSDTPAPCP